MIIYISAFDSSEQNQMLLLYKTHSQTMLRYAYSIVKAQDLAEDVVHNVFLKLLIHLDKFQDIGSQQTKRYLIAATRNMCFDMMKTHVYEELDDDLSDETGDPVWEQVQIREVIGDVTGLIEEMRDTDKGILIYRFAWQYSCREIADIYNTTENYITARISRLRKAIKKGLKPKWGDIHELV